MIEPTTLSLSTARDGSLRVTLETLMRDEQRILVSMNVHLTDQVPLVRIKIAAYEQALKVLQDSLVILRKQLPADQPSPPGGS